MDVDMKSDTQTKPLVCNMNVFTPVERERHIHTTSQLFQTVQGIHKIRDGFEFIFPKETENILQIAEFISNERRCCPFLEFTLKIASDNEPISLILTGPAGTQEFLREEFSEAFYENHI
jgi:hypothetical protein